MPKAQRTPRTRAKLDENARNLGMLSLFLNEAPGFRLGLAAYDVPETREKYLNELVDAVADQPVHVTRLDLSQSPDEELLLDRLEDHLRANPAHEGKHPAVMVVGLEAAIDFHRVPPSQIFQGGPILRNANFHRDAYVRFCPAPIVVWLNSRAYTAFAQAAPDLWDWRSGTFSFQGPPGLRGNRPIETISSPIFEIENQPLDQPREWIGTLRDLVTTLENEDDRVTAGYQTRLAALLR
jgi:hypothetical protein